MKENVSGCFFSEHSMQSKRRRLALILSRNQKKVYEMKLAIHSQMWTYTQSSGHMQSNGGITGSWENQKSVWHQTGHTQSNVELRSDTHLCHWTLPAGWRLCHGGRATRWQ